MIKNYLGGLVIMMQWMILMSAILRFQLHQFGIAGSWTVLFALLQSFQNLIFGKLQSIVSQERNGRQRSDASASKCSQAQNFTFSQEWRNDIWYVYQTTLERPRGNAVKWRITSIRWEMTLAECLSIAFHFFTKFQSSVKEVPGATEACNVF